MVQSSSADKLVQSSFDEHSDRDFDRQSLLMTAIDNKSWCLSFGTRRQHRLIGTESELVLDYLSQARRMGAHYSESDNGRHVSLALAQEHP